MFLRHGNDYLAVGSIHLAHWSEGMGELVLKVGPDAAMIRLEGDEAVEARATLDALCVRVNDSASQGANDE